MKLIAVVILTVLAAAVKGGSITEEEKAALLALVPPCQQESGATDADIAKMKRHEMAETKEGKCFVACIMKKLDVMDANGKFNKDAAMKLAELHTHNDAEKMQIAEAVMSACKDISVSDDHCEASQQYKGCLKAEAAKHGIHPEAM